MASLNTRGGASSINRFAAGSGGKTNDCPFSVMAYKDADNAYKAYVDDGEINFTKFYDVNSGGETAAEIAITPDCEVALMVKFLSDDYEYKKITEIFAVKFDASDRNKYATQVVDQGSGKYEITMYIPLAYIYKFTPQGSDIEVLKVKQYFCGHINFRMYHCAVNGKLSFDFFKTFGIGVGKIP
jgi:hypothetical protein